MALEPVEDPVDEFGRYAPAFIAYAEHDVAAAPLGRNRDGLAATRKADRVGQQVEEHLPDALGIRDHRAEARLRLTTSSRILDSASRS